MTVGLCGDFWTDEVIRLLLKGIDAVLWPVFVHWSINEWENEQYKKYTEKGKNICKNIFFVNPICINEDSESYGGAFGIVNSEIKYKMDMMKEEILICEY